MTDQNQANPPADASASATAPDGTPTNAPQGVPTDASTETAPTDGTTPPSAPNALPGFAHAPSDWPLPLLHLDSNTLRFWVAVPGAPAVGATIGLGAMHHRFNAALDGSNAVATYQANQATIDEAVRGRVARGSIEPVMLREADLPALPRR